MCGGVGTEATRDLSCPTGCFELEISARHASRDPVDVLEEITRDGGTCPQCGEDLPGVWD